MLVRAAHVVMANNRVAQVVKAQEKAAQMAALERAMLVKQLTEQLEKFKATKQAPTAWNLAKNNYNGHMAQGSLLLHLLQ